MRVILSVIASALVLIFVGLAVRRARRRRDVPELNQHPERLEQALDSSDDA
jgi:hypothetical protein